MMLVFITISLTMKRTFIAWSVFILALVAGALCLLAPVPSNPTYTTLSFYAFLIVTVMIAILYVGSSIIFLTSLKGFTPQLKRSYAWLCVGFIILGLAFVQLPLIVYGGS